MLNCYPLEASNENWLHEAVLSLVKAVHQKLDANEVINSTKNTWNNLVELIPNEDNRNLIKATHGIRDRLFKYKDVLVSLNQQQRQIVLQTIDSQNSIVELLNGTKPIALINNSHPELHNEAQELFVFCFGKLTDFEVRHRQYKIIFDSLPDKICPFCGIDRVMNPEDTAQDQDHYLAKSIYPFAAVNMRNLVPMCRCCNRDYKKDADVLLNALGQRREVFDPYNCTPPEISLNNSSLIASASPIRFDWNIEFLTNQEEAETWDEVFSIRKRYKRDILEVYFDKWLDGFRKVCIKERGKGLIKADSTKQQIREKLQDYQESREINPNIGLAGFLEPLALNFLLKLFDQSNERVVNLIRDAVLGINIEELA